ncbi:DNA-binding response regulator [Prauserella coralliicola]|uniref:DNA-binding response regulator n=3 Tax=Pseudonocardiaceae TaxID=2070 RepID=A0A2V4ASE8_9PSEU|nr:DNA-binding response regulator [Amycolatopsis albispora]MBE1579638.1 two-component system OmpR family response regulator [Amycolatopsis roodepoortensis]OLT41620.1 DNA-binding response regulator [Saccharomonospora sp. CUA-673]PXY18060.1 DNA-binding response regulator [Prauserella muralis]PXY18489.1 DNA-binding response regulator [Prauserella coralliicola]
MVRVLVVEDEPKMAGLLRRGLVEEGYAVDVATDGADGFGAAVSRDYDAVVLDVMLPRLSGFEMCRRLRRQQVWVPVLMLTARDAVTDRISGLDGGADDYLTKPFHLEELFARLRALTRRGPVARPTVLTAGDLRIDPASRRCWRGETEIAVTAKEYALLEMFLRQPGVVLTRELLLEHCWDFAYESRSNVVEVHIRALRDKIDRPFAVVSLETVRGAGYRLRPDGGRPRVGAR